MALLLKGEEFITTEALSAKILTGLIRFARHRPLVLNGIELHADDLARLAEEATLSGRPVWPNALEKAAHQF
jgi:hypothetical protein